MLVSRDRTGSDLTSFGYITTRSSENDATRFCASELILRVGTEIRIPRVGPRHTRSVVGSRPGSLVGSSGRRPGSLRSEPIKRRVPTRFCASEPKSRVGPDSVRRSRFRAAQPKNVNETHTHPVRSTMASLKVNAVDPTLHATYSLHGHTHKVAGVRGSVGDGSVGGGSVGGSGGGLRAAERRGVAARVPPS